MADDDKTPGTPADASGTLGEEIPQDGASATRPDDGSDLEHEPTVEELKAEVERLENIHRQSLGEKQSLEEARRELADLRARNNQPLTPDPRQSEVERDLEEQRQDIANLRADANDPNNPNRHYARMTLKTAEFAYRQTLQLADELKLSRLPDDQAEEVKRIRQQRPYLSLDDAREMAVTSARTKALEKELEDLKKGRVAAAAPARSGVAVTRPVGAAEARELMTQRQYSERLQSLAAAGKDEERRQLVLQRSRGALKLRDG